jgi:transcriptional regulator with XRE-family HTH domain
VAQSFGEKLKKLRREHGLSQDQLGQKAGVHGRHIGKYEIGRAMPNAESVVRLAQVLGVSIDSLLRDDFDPSLSGEAVLRDEKLLRKFQAVEKMPEEDKHVVLSLIDAYIKKQQMEAVLQD